MTESSSFAYSVLSDLHDYYGRHDMSSRLAEPDDEAPYASLLIRFDEIGSGNDSVLLELSFLPGLEEAEQAGVFLLQTFAVLRDRTAPERYPSLVQACAGLNLTLPIGAFGVSEPGGALYFKHNAMLRREWLTGELGVQHLDRVNGLALHQLHLYADTLLSEA